MLMYEGNSLEEIEKYGITQVLSENVTAIVCGSSSVACCVWKVAERTRIAVPNELSVIAIGDDEVFRNRRLWDFSGTASE